MMIWRCLALILSLSGCGQTVDFGSRRNNQLSSGGVDVDSGDGDAYGNVDEPQTKDIDQNSSKTAEPAVPCIAEKAELDIVIALDISYSMGPVLDIVKGNLIEFITNANSNLMPGNDNVLQKINIGLLTFEDNIGAQTFYPFTENVLEISQILNDLKLRSGFGNYDGPEAGLLAARTAIEAIHERSSQTTNTIILVVLMITDNYSHNGTGPFANRDYSTDALQMLLADKLFDFMLLYDSVPNTVVPDIYVPTSILPAGSPSDQWQALRKIWQKANPTIRVDAGGDSLQFPLREFDLTTALPNAIKSALRFCPNS